MDTTKHIPRSVGPRPPRRRRKLSSLRMPHKERYLVLVAGGLEHVAVDELKERLYFDSADEDINVISSQPEDGLTGEALVGKILVKTYSSPSQVASLRTIQAAYAFLFERSDVITDSAAGLEQIEKLVDEEGDWPSALRLWRRSFDEWKDESLRGTADAPLAQQALSSPTDSSAHTSAVKADAGAEAHKTQWQAEGGLVVSEGDGCDRASLLRLLPRPLPTFRVSTVRDGRHKYRSPEVSGHIGAAVIDLLGLEVDLSAFTMEVVAILYQQHLVVALSLPQFQPVKGNSLAAEERRHLRSSKRKMTLRPSTAELLLRVAEPTTGDIVLDCMCGVGTVPVMAAVDRYEHTTRRNRARHEKEPDEDLAGRVKIEVSNEGNEAHAPVIPAQNRVPNEENRQRSNHCEDSQGCSGPVESLEAVSKQVNEEKNDLGPLGDGENVSGRRIFRPTVFGLGGDFAEDAVAKTKENMCGRPRVDVCLWDASVLPLRDATVDRVIVDMPFGVSCGSSVSHRKLLPKVVREIIRVLRVGGKAVLLVMGKKILGDSLKARQIQVLDSRRVNIGGLGCFLFVFVKTCGKTLPEKASVAEAVEHTLT